MEHTDEYGDIQDTYYADKLGNLSLTSDILGTHPVICLERSTGNDEEGLQERTYAYPTEGRTLPDTFDVGHSVPPRYKHEYARFIVFQTRGEWK